MGGRIGRWWLAGAGKWPERVAAMAKTDSKNSLTGGDCGRHGGAGVVAGGGPETRRRRVEVVPV